MQDGPYPEDKTLKEILGFKPEKMMDVLHSDAAEEDRERDTKKSVMRMIS